MVWRVALVCTLVFFMLGTSFARPSEGASYRFLPLSKDLNLDQLITAVVQDASGSVWIGTQSGLFRFDGISVENHSAQLMASSKLIFAFHVDTQGALWIGTEVGAFVFDTVSLTFSEIHFPQEKNISPRVFGFEEFSHGTLMATSDGLFLVEDGETELLDDLDGNIGRTVVVDRENTIWVGTERNGLYVSTEEGFVRYPHLADVRYVRDLHLDRDDLLWVGTINFGVFRVDPSANQVEQLGALNLDENSRVRALAEDQHGNVWLGSDSGVHRWNRSENSFSFYSPAKSKTQGESLDVIYDLHVDFSGTVWLGTYSGVLRFNPDFVSQKLVVLDGLNVNGAITSFAESPNSQVAVGTTEGVALWEESVDEVKDLVANSEGLEAFVTALEFSNDGHLWIGTFSKGLYGWSDGLLHGPYDVSGRFAKHGISDLYIDEDELLWVATVGAGVHSFNLSSQEIRSYPELQNPQGKFPDLKCLGIHPQNDGRFWIATNDSGPFLFDPLTGNTVDYSKGMERHAQSVLVDDETIWAASYTGKLSALTWRTNSIANPLPALDPPVRAIYGLQSLAGKLLLADQGRLLVFDSRNKSLRILDDRHNTIPDVAHGASIKLSSGAVLFGGKAGFNVLKSDDIFQSKYQYDPTVELNRIQINHEPLRGGANRSRLELEHHENDLLLAYMVTDFLHPGKIESTYKLEGFDDSWIDNGTSRSITYTNLDPGSYVLRVKATNSDGVWSPNELVLPILISPPWWSTVWAYTLYTLVALFLFYQLLQLSARRVTVRAEERFNKRLRHYVSALDDASECVFNTSESGRILYVNDAIREVLGKRVSEAIGHSLFEVLFESEEQRAVALEELDRQGSFLGELEHKTDQKEKILEVSIREGESLAEDKVGFVCVVRDVTARSQQFRALESEIRELTAELERVTDDLKESVANSARYQSEAERRLRQDEHLLKSFHDRINDNFQMLTSLFSIQAAKSSDGAVVDMLDENQQRIKTVGLVHEQLLQTKELNRVAMADYVDVLATSLYRRLAPSNIQLELIKELGTVHLAMDQAVPAGLILNELVTNSLIHGFKGKTHGSGKLKVSFYELAGYCVIMISDDGQGLPKEFQSDSGSGVGFEIVSILTQQLGGSFKRVGGIGTTFEVRFPITSST